MVGKPASALVVVPGMISATPKAQIATGPMTLMNEGRTSRSPIASQRPATTPSTTPTGMRRAAGIRRSARPVTAAPSMYEPVWQIMARPNWVGVSPTRSIITNGSSTAKV